MAVKVNCAQDQKKSIGMVALMQSLETYIVVANHDTFGVASGTRLHREKEVVDAYISRGKERREILMNSTLPFIERFEVTCRGQMASGTLEPFIASVALIAHGVLQTHS